MRFMQTESVLQTKNRSGPAKNRFSVALMMRLWCKVLCHISAQTQVLINDQFSI